MRLHPGHLLIAITWAVPSAAQIPGAVPATREPHHHLAYEDSSIVVLRVEVPAHDSTLLHEHAADYFWIGLGRATIVNARLGSAPVSLMSEDRAVHYARGGFAHVALTQGPAPFRNITVELRGPQGVVRNRCEAAVADAPLDCPGARRTESGILEHPAFVTERLGVDLVTFAPGAELRGAPHARGTWVITLDPSEERLLQVKRGARGTSPPGRGWRGGTWRAPDDEAWSLVNVSGRTVSALVIAARRP